MIFSLSLVFSNQTSGVCVCVCVCMVFNLSYLGCYEILIYGLMSFIILEIFFIIISSNVSSALSFYSFPLWLQLLIYWAI